MKYLLLLIKKCFYGKRKHDWIGERFWRLVLPHIITVNMLKKYANKMNCVLEFLFMLNVINTQKKIDALYEASTLEQKAFVLSFVESFRIARKNNFVYPSFELIDKDIEKIQALPCPPMIKVYQTPEDRLANGFCW